MEKTKQTPSKVICSVLAFVLLLSTGLCAETPTDPLLDMVPEGSLFCVRLNNFDYTMGQMDQFLAGVSPMPMSITMVARMQLAGLLGDPTLGGVDTTGNFAIFGMASRQQTTSLDKPQDVWGAALLPVKNYEQFVNLSNNVAPADTNGVSKITPSQMGPKSKAAISVKVGDYALVGAEKNYDWILSIAKSISANENSPMTKSLAAEQIKLAGQVPVWAYGDIEQINKSFGPFIASSLENMQKEMQQAMTMTGQAPMGDPAEVMKIYKDMVQKILEQGRFVSITLKPEPSVLRITETLKAKPETELYKLFTADPTLPKENKLLGYLEDGSAINIAAKVDRASMKKMAEIGMSFMKAAPGSASSEEMTQWEQLMQDSVEATGNILAMSLKADPNTKPPLAMKYLVEIKDQQKYRQTQDRSLELMNQGAMKDMYKQMGVACEIKVEKNISQYKGVSIDSGIFQFKATDTNSPEAQMIQMMYGDGFKYRMAFVDEYFTTVMGGNMDAAMKALIDQIKAGPKEPEGEVKTAMDLLSGAKTADCFGTVNLIRLMHMGMSFAPVPIPIPFGQVQTRSNIAFTGTGADGKLTIDVAIPKEHLAELMAIAMMMQPQTAPSGQGESVK